MWQASDADVETPVRPKAEAEPVVTGSTLSKRDEKSNWRAPASSRVELAYARETARRDEPAKLEEPEPEEQRFSRVVVEDTGTLTADKVTIRLAGLEPLPVDARCESSKKTWPCGKVGRGALRRLIRGRTVACKDLSRLSETELTGRCTVASIDINEWLVRYGWARPQAGETAPYEKALDTAQREGRGQWRPRVESR